MGLKYESDRLNEIIEGLKQSLRAAPIPIQGLILDNQEWHQNYRRWWYENASEIAIENALGESSETPENDPYKEAMGKIAEIIYEVETEAFKARRNEVISQNQADSEQLDKHVPINHENGHTGGNYCEVCDLTQQLLNERQLTTTLRETMTKLLRYSTGGEYGEYGRQARREAREALAEME